MRKKVFIGAIILVLAAVTGLSIAVHIAGRDIPAPDTRDLVIERPAISPEENAYTHFVSAMDSLYWPTNYACLVDYLEGEPADDAFVREIIDQNSETIRMVEKGLECRVCLVPEITTLNSSTTYLWSWRNFGRLLALKSRHDRLAGEHAKATRTCVSLLHFAGLILHEAESAIYYMVGISVLEMGLQQVRDIVTDGRASQEEIRKLSEILTTFDSVISGFIRANKAEYKVAAATIDDIGDGKRTKNAMAKISKNLSDILKQRKNQGYYFQPNNTKLAFANVCRNMISNAPVCYVDIKRHDVENILESKGSGASKVVRLLFRPNGVGKWLCAILVPNLDSILARKCQAECDLSATRLVVALNAYEKKEGKLPADLQVLIPGYLDAIPRDPYDGKPFRYVPEKGIIYAVGKDLKDSGGSTNVIERLDSRYPSGDRWKKKDVVFEINRAKEE